ncbi:STAS domain-containing protein [Dethiosulfatarculus sandiegensis]|uniref:STAS domain-containing protein n=1 Tax=Dethiosulfatarculus sandiegensis TaxID=1429043 RepID=A0A0D2JT54_9BACT|nr:STAS domain-containing protein [Dethiosulfatarculus sandiegensis]KIX12665.1 hypothetical protein X474_17940 [Dethiosulfatarculus sandiegensis]
MSKVISHNGDGMHVVDDCLVASVNAEPDDRELQMLREQVLAKVEKIPLSGVVLDVSRVRLLDSVLFGLLAQTFRMIKLLGKRAVFVGFQAGVASALVDLDIELDDLETALTMKDGLEILRGDSQSENPTEEDLEDHNTQEEENDPIERQIDESIPGY